MPNPDHEYAIRHGLPRRSFLSIASGAAATALLAPAALAAAPSLSLDGAGSSCAALRSSAFASTTPMASNASTIEAYLGATKSALQELLSHENDDYYLGTPYGNTGPGKFSTDLSSWDCWHPNGNPKKNGEAYMNCAGFVVAVLEACGADCSKIGGYVAASGYNRGNKANLSRWKNWLDDHAYLRTRYSSKSALLASGKLRKGDLIIAEPNDWSKSGADNHIMFFWGDVSSQDRAWHSAAHGDGIVSGKAPGNMISRITAKHSDCHWLHVPLENLLEIVLRKRSADASVASGLDSNSAYSLAGARFSIFANYQDGKLSDLLGTFSTNANGNAGVELAPGSTVWIREDKPPLGFTAWETPKKLVVKRNESNATLEDAPCSIRVLVKKEDAETENAPQGWATLEGASFELVDANGRSRTAKTCWNEEEQSWIASFEKVPRGRARIKEISAPSGYVLNEIEGANENGWKQIELKPDSHAETFTLVALSHKNRVIRGDIVGIKFREDPQAEERKSPLAECQFEIWLQDDGSLKEKGYKTTAVKDANGAAVRDKNGNALHGVLMGCVSSDKNGRFSSRDLLHAWNPKEHNGEPRPNSALPYGTYTLIETKCPDASLKLLEPICDLEIRSDGQEVFLILEDRLIASPVRILKTDADSGKPILREGTEIELLRKRKDGTYETVEFVLHYPEERTVKTFTIPASGIIQFPERLAKGSYAIKEVAAVPPYLVDQTPVSFEVDANYDWKEADAIEIELPNSAATGSIEFLKKDATSGDGVEGATYEIRTKEDVKSPDGTVHHSAGDVVATPTTDENGTWKVDGLCLGEGSTTYEISERKSPDGYVFDQRVYEVSLSYEDDKTATVANKTTVEEKPVMVKISKKDSATGKPIEGVRFTAAPEETKAGDTVSDKERTAETDKTGTAEFTRLSCGKTYRFVEAESRPDLGYACSHHQETRYLDPNGLWHASREAYEGNPEKGTEECLISFENDCTKVAVYKVDEELWKAASRATTDKEAKRLEQEALIGGGSFGLVDEHGKPLSVIVDGKSCESWTATKEGPRIITYLQPGKRYAIVEKESPSGYYRSSARTEFLVGDTAEVQTVVIGNRKVSTLPATSDIPRWALPATAASVAATAGLLAYSRRRVEVEREQAGCLLQDETEG